MYLHVSSQRRDARGARTVQLPYYSTVVRGGSAVVAKRVGTVTIQFADGQERAQARGTAGAYIDRAAATIPEDIRQRIALTTFYLRQRTYMAAWQQQQLIRPHPPKGCKRYPMLIFYNKSLPIRQLRRQIIYQQRRTFFREITHLLLILQSGQQRHAVVGP